MTEYFFFVGWNIFIDIKSFLAEISSFHSHDSDEDDSYYFVTIDVKFPTSIGIRTKKCSNPNKIETEISSPFNSNDSYYFVLTEVEVPISFKSRTEKY